MVTSGQARRHWRAHLRKDRDPISTKRGARLEDSKGPHRRSGDPVCGSRDAPTEKRARKVAYLCGRSGVRGNVRVARRRHPGDRAPTPVASYTLKISFTFKPIVKSARRKRPTEKRLRRGSAGHQEVSFRMARGTRHAPCTRRANYQDNSSGSTLASWKSAVSKPNVADVRKVRWSGQLVDLAPPEGLTAAGSPPVL
jgi:hypothetical protein